jgi:ABC-type multidrug transport system ATPase subunit
MEPPMIHFENVCFSYEKDTAVLTGIDLEFRPGLTMLLGPNGCGKSTLLKLASGVERPDTGSISIDGYDLWQSEVEARKDLVYVPEHPDLTPYATIREILNLVCRLRNEPLDKGMDALKFFGLLEVASRTVRELSLGQRRRAVFAAALIGTPRYILLDEPLEGMDRKITGDILTWIKRHVDDDAVVVVVSHTIEPFVDLTSQAITIKSGCAIHCPNLPIGSEKIFAILDNLAKGIIETKGIIER